MTTDSERSTFVTVLGFLFVLLGMGILSGDFWLDRTIHVLPFVSFVVASGFGTLLVGTGSAPKAFVLIVNGATRLVPYKGGSAPTTDLNAVTTEEAQVTVVPLQVECGQPPAPSSPSGSAPPATVVPPVHTAHGPDASPGDGETPVDADVAK